MRSKGAEAMLDNSDFVSRGAVLIDLLAAAAVADTAQADPSLTLQEWPHDPDPASPHYLVQAFLLEHKNRRVAVQAVTPGDEPIEYFLSYPNYGQANLGFIWGFVSPRFARRDWQAPMGFRVKASRFTRIPTSVVNTVHDDGSARVQIAISD